MSVMDDILARFPAEVQDTVRGIWETVGPGEKASFLSLLSGFPTDTNLAKILVKLSAEQLKQAFGSKHRVAIIGPTNVGKSTLYNQMVQHKSDRAEVSALPGTTKDNQQADAALFMIVDTPGADAVGTTGEEEKHKALSAASEADFVILVFDAIQGIKKTELELFNEITALKKPFVVVLNKTDLVSRKDMAAVLASAAANLGLRPEQVLPIAARDGKNLANVLLAVAAAEPGMAAALGQALPEYRWQLAWQAIVRSASISAAIALIPLPVIDFVPLVTTQSIMVVSIARIYDYRITAKARLGAGGHVWAGVAGADPFPAVEQTGRHPWLGAERGDCFFDDCGDGVCGCALV